MGGRGSSGTAKIPNMGGTNSRASNKKYKGFSITQEGKTENYIVVKGVVQYADGRPSRTGLVNTDELEVMQKAYEIEGNTKGLIDRINNIGNAKATILPDKEVTRLKKARDKSREESEKEFNKNYYKRRRGINRHRANWSAM